MEIFKILQKKSKYFYFFLLVLGLTNALWNNALLLLINNKLTNQPLPFFEQYASCIFIILIIVSFVASRYFQIFMLKLTSDLSYEMGVQIFRKVRAATNEHFQKYGKEKIYSLIHDTEVVSQFPSAFVDAFNSLIVFIVGLTYLFTVSVLGALFVLIILLVVSTLYYWRTKKTMLFIEQTRSLSDDYHKNIHDLLNGFKEIKMSSVKSNNLYNRLNSNRHVVKNLNLAASVKWLDNELLGRYFWYILIGIILYVLPKYYLIDSKMITTFIVILLFLIGPIGSLIGVIPFYSKITTSMNKLRQFDMNVDQSEMELNINRVNSRYPDFKELIVKNVTYAYTGECGEPGFSVDVQEFKVKRGEIIFITGGNGSGKTTFLNILLGLVPQHSGEIYYNGVKVEKQDIPRYRNSIAAIFASDYLLSQNYEDFIIDDKSEVLREFIALMKLDSIVKIDVEANRLEIELSKGQQKRISMIYALMENKDILVLDEWAADQDPAFKAYFYNEFLPELRLRGKTVILVTHDDNYYKFADRIIKFTSGEVSEVYNDIKS